jgi:hypothetical protein
MRPARQAAKPGRARRGVPSSLAKPALSPAADTARSFVDRGPRDPSGEMGGRERSEQLEKR